MFWELLPSVRRYIAQKLRREGKTLPEIGKILGVSKSAVSQYLSGKRGEELPGWMKEIVDRKLSENCTDIMEIIYEISHDRRFQKGW